jgi:ATP-dependent Clp protease ATP-binding subunit ClpC
MMALPDFWSSPERFTVMGEVEYRERLENGLKTAATLLRKLHAENSGSLERFSTRLLGQAAERLLLLDRARQAMEAHQPWEAMIMLEVKTDSGVPTTGDRQWLARLRDMYLSWASRRKMQVKVLQDNAGPLTETRPVILAVSGYAAYSILATETGLHIWEEPSTLQKQKFDHSQVMVRVSTQPEELSGQPGADLLPATLALLAEPLPGAPVIVRNYRQLPDPLVKDRVHGWRSGRLERVLEGNFDLLGWDQGTAGAAQG